MTTRRLLGRLGLSLFGLLVGLLIVELALRFTHREPWYERLTGEQLRKPRTPHPVNRWSLRDRNYGPKPPNVRRVLVIGDSFTYGSGVHDEDAVFPRRVEVELDRSVRLGDGVREFEVLNGGIPASLTTDWVRLWRRVGTDFDPDAVVIVFFLRDGTRTSTVGAFFGPIRNEIVARNQQSDLYRYSYVYRAVRDAQDRRLVGDVYGKAITDSYLGSESDKQEWTLARKNLLELRDAVRRHGAAVGLVVFPILIDLDEHYPFAAVCDEIETFARENGLPFLSLLPAFAGKSGPDLWVSAYDQHPNAEAHRVAATAITPFVEDLLRQHESR